MAVSEAAKLLDELMGRYRNLAADEKPVQLTWDSDEMCHYFLGHTCPHTLFCNTRVDLGTCKNQHDDDVKLEFNKLPAYKRAAYEDEFTRFAQKLVTEIDRKIARCRDRLALKPDDRKLASLLAPQHTEQEERVQVLTDKINKLVDDAEAMGTEGKVEEAQGIMRLCDNLRREREALRRNIEGSMWIQAAESAASHEKQMDVCEICGSFLLIGDAQSRIDDHLSGKIHRGYAKLREAMDEIRERRDKDRQELEEKRNKMRQEMEQEGGKDTRPRSRDRDRGSGRDRERRDRHGNVIENKYNRQRSDGDGRRDSSRDDRRDRDRDRRDKYDRNGHRSSHDEKRRERRRSRSRSPKRRRSKSRDRSRKSRDEFRDRSRRSRDKSRDRVRKSRDSSRDKSRKSRDKSGDRLEKSRERSKSRDKAAKDSSGEKSHDKERGGAAAGETVVAGAGESVGATAPGESDPAAESTTSPSHHS